MAALVVSIGSAWLTSGSRITAPRPTLPCATCVSSCASVARPAADAGSRSERRNTSLPWVNPVAPSIRVRASLLGPWCTRMPPGKLCIASLPPACMAIRFCIDGSTDVGDSLIARSRDLTRLPTAALPIDCCSSMTSPNGDTSGREGARGAVASSCLFDPWLSRVCRMTYLTGSSHRLSGL